MIKLKPERFTRLLIICNLGIFLFLPFAAGANQAKENYKGLQNKAQTDMTLIGRLAESPELMNVDYLECYLGPKTTSAVTASGQVNGHAMPASIVLWTDSRTNATNYKLETGPQAAGTSLVEFDTMVLDKAHQQMKDMNKVMNVSAQHSFDEKGQPIQIYDSRPDTKVLVYRVPGLVDINKIRLIYSGSPLPLPSAAQMQEAITHRRDWAFSEHKAGHNAKAITLLKAHLRINPDDAEAHLVLAECYKSQCDINGSIKEYRIALDRSSLDTQNDDENDLHKRCIEGLKSLKIDPPAETAANTANQSTDTSPQNSADTYSPTPTRSPERINLNDVGF